MSGRSSKTNGNPPVKKRAKTGEGPSSLNVKVQRKGIVYKLPFRKNMSGSWKKRLFVVKDGTLFVFFNVDIV